PHPMLPLLFSLSHNYTLLAYKPHYHKSISYLIWIIMRRAIISRTVEGIDRTIIVGIVNDDIKDGKGVIRTVEDDHNVAIKGIIAAGETEGYAVGFGLQCSLIEEGGVDLQCGLSTRIGSNKKQAIERLRQSESVRTLLSGDSGILSIEQPGSSQRKQ
ncbi:MAG: hypothetical protein ACEY3M_01060, partial [Wolbachia sp.]